MTTSTNNPDDGAPQSPRAKFPFSEQLRAGLEAYRAANNLTNGKLALKLDYGVTQISKYINTSADFDVTKLEERVADLLKTAAAKREESASLFDSPIARKINSACETIRKTNDVGLVHGPAGVGKTKGIDLYCAANPLAIRVTLSKWNASAAGVEAAIYDLLDSSAKPYGMRRTPWMIERLKHSNRPIVIDNAHRLTSSGRKWLFDYYDETNQPIMLVGNPELLTAIRANDQQFSRIGLLREVSIDPVRADALSRQMLERHCPEHVTALLDLATKVASERGHLRALKKHLLLMPEFMDVCGGKVRKAFQMAHTQLVADYTLED